MIPFSYQNALMADVASAALSLNFAGMSSGAELTAKGVTFSRAGNAMHFDKTGKLTYAPNNLLRYTGDLTNGAWNKANCTVTGGVSDPFGGTGAFTITATGNNGECYQQYGVLGVQPALVISSAWIRRRTGTGAVDLRQPNNGGAVTTITSEWKRYFKAPLTGDTFSFYLSTSGDAIDVYAPQYEVVTYQTAPRPYIATGSSSVYEPRFDYDPVTLLPKGLLMEESRTNSLTEFPTNWNTGGGTLTANSALAPNGLTKAALLNFNGGPSDHQSYINSSQGVGDTAFSCFAKAGTGRYLSLTAGDSGNYIRATFDLQAGVVTQSEGVVSVLYGAIIQKMSDGWYRLVVSGARTSGGYCVISYAADPTYTPDAFGRQAGLTLGADQTYYVFGAQQEVGKFVTSYIPTNTASVTRAADTAAMTGVNFSSWYNNIEGTFVVDAEMQNTAETYILGVHTVSEGNVLQLSTQNTSSGFGILAIPDWLGTSIKAKDFNRFAGAYKSGDSGSANNGTLGALQASAFTNGAATGMKIGVRGDGYAPMTGHIRSIEFYNTRLDNAALQLKSAPNLKAALALDLNFTSGVLDPRITFARSGQAMCHDATGKLTYAPNNLLFGSNDFAGSYWQKGESTIITAGGVNDPFGGLNASTLRFDGANGYLYYIGNNSTNTGTMGVSSIWMRKRSGTDSLIMYRPDDTSVTVTLTTSWQRFSTYGLHNSNRALLLYAGGVANNEIDIFGAQFEAVTYQTTPRAYVPTTSAAYYGPRFDHDPATTAPRGLLIEESRTNYARFSLDMTDADWILDGVTRTGGISDPAGTTKAVTLTGTGGNRRLFISSLAPGSAVYTISVYVRRRTGTGTIRIWDANYSEVDITSQVTSVWSRVSVSATGPGGYSLIILGTNGDEIDVFGFQIEPGSFATSFIPTGSSAVTRPAEQASITGAAFSAFYNNAEGTFVIDLPDATQDNSHQFAVVDASEGRVVDLAGGPNLAWYGNGGLNVQMATPTAPVRVAVAYKVNDAPISANGAMPAIETTCTFADGAALRIGYFSGGQALNNYANGCIKRLQYYNFRVLPNQLRRLSGLEFLIGDESDGGDVIAGATGVANFSATIAGSVTANAGVAPDGTTTAYLFTENTADNRHVFYTQSVIAANKTRTWSVYAKANSRRYFQMSGDVNAIFDLQDGVVSDYIVANANQSNLTVKCERAFNGFFKCTIQWTQSTSDGGFSVYGTADRATIGGVNQFGNVQYTGDGASGVYVWRSKIVIT